MDYAATTLLGFLLFFLTSITVSKVDENCPKIFPIKKLVLSKFEGTWYVAQGVPIEIPEDCIKVRIVKTSDTTFKAYVTEFNAEHGYFIRDRAIASLKYPPKGIFTMKTFEGEHYDHLPNVVIGTDYNNYAALFTCYFGNQTAWVLTRTQHPTQEIFKRAKQTLRRKKLNGVWYNVASSIVQNVCVNIDFIDISSDVVVYRVMEKSLANNSVTSLLNQKEIMDPFEPEFTVQMGYINAFPFSIVASDYLTYFLVYACFPNKAVTYIFTTQSMPPVGLINTANEKIKELGLPPNVENPNDLNCVYNNFLAN